MPTHVGDGATTTHGGRVQASCGAEMNYYGLRPLRMGDSFYCPLCKCESKFIGSGVDHGVILYGKPALLDGAIATCGAVLLPNNFNMVRELGGGAKAGNSTSNLKPIISSDYDQHILFTDSLTGVPLRNQPYRLEVNGNIIEGVTDSEGKTKVVQTGPISQNISWHLLGVNNA